MKSRKTKVPEYPVSGCHIASLRFSSTEHMWIKLDHSPDTLCVCVSYWPPPSHFHYLHLLLSQLDEGSKHHCTALTIDGDSKAAGRDELLLLVVDVFSRRRGNGEDAHKQKFHWLEVSVSRLRAGRNAEQSHNTTASYLQMDIWTNYVHLINNLSCSCQALCLTTYSNKRHTATIPNSVEPYHKVSSQREIV